MSLHVWRRPMNFRSKCKAGFTLVELLVVLMIMAVLMALIMPALARARQRGAQVVCESNLRQIGMLLMLYMNENKGWLYPVGVPDPKNGGRPATLGTNVPRAQRWPVYIFDPPVYNPPIMLCPSDYEPMEEHSYLLNQHLSDHAIKYSGSDLGGLFVTDIVVMGEKVSNKGDYYMERYEFQAVVEPYRHGTGYGSNYLYLDIHVSTTPPNAAEAGMDPWDPPVPLATPAPS